MSTMEVHISRVLRLGVGMGFLLIAGGTALSFVHHPEYTSSPAALERLTVPTPAPSLLMALLPGLRHGRGQAVVTVGLLVLILTPVVRVAMSFAMFVRQGDRSFAAMTALVLFLILLSIVLGRASA